MIDKIGIILVGKIKKIKLLDEIYKSLEINFMKNKEKYYFIFTDNESEIVNIKIKNVNIIKIEKNEDDKYNLNIYNNILNIKEKLINMEIDMLYNYDIDLNIISDINETFIATRDKPLICVTHAYYFNKSLGNPENRNISKAYIDEQEKRMFYITGKIWGGLIAEYLSVCEIIKEWIEIDNNNGIISKEYGESYLNRYMVSNQELFKYFPPSYCYPNNDNIIKLKYELENKLSEEEKEKILKELPFLRYYGIILCKYKENIIN